MAHTTIHPKTGNLRIGTGSGNDPGRTRHSLARALMMAVVAAAGAAAAANASAQECRSGFRDYVVAATEVRAPAGAVGATQRWRSQPFSTSWEGPGPLPVVNATPLGYAFDMTVVSGRPPTLRTMPVSQSPLGSVVPWKTAAGAVGEDGVAVDTFGPLHAGGRYTTANVIEFDQPLTSFRFAVMDLDWTGERISNVRFIDSAGRVIRLSSLSATARDFSPPSPLPVPELSATAAVTQQPGVFFYHDSPLIAYDPSTDTIGRPSGVTQNASDSTTSVFVGLNDGIEIKSVAFDFIIEGLGGPKFTFSGRHACEAAQGVPAASAVLPLGAMAIMLAAVAAFGWRRRTGQVRVRASRARVVAR